VALVATNGFEQRFADRARMTELLDAPHWMDPQANACGYRTEADVRNDSLCRRGRTGVAPSFVLLGDSHAQAIAHAVFTAADQIGVSGVQLTALGYMPLPGRKNLGIDYAPDMNPTVLDWLERHREIRTVIVTGYWLYEATSKTYRHTGTIFADAQYDGTGLAYNPKALRHALDRLVERFPDRRFVFLDDAPSGRDIFVKHYVRAMVAHGQAPARIPFTEAQQQQEAYLPILQAVAASHDNVRVAPVLTRSVCDAQQCSLFTPDGLLKFHDGDHLSDPYALRLTDKLGAALASDLRH